MTAKKATKTANPSAKKAAEERWNLKNVVAYKNGSVELSFSAVTA